MNPIRTYKNAMALRESGVPSNLQSRTLEEMARNGCFPKRFNTKLIHGYVADDVDKWVSLYSDNVKMAIDSCFSIACNEFMSGVMAAIKEYQSEVAA